MIARLFTHTSLLYPCFPVEWNYVAFGYVYTMFSCFFISPLTLTDDPAWSTHLFIPSCVCTYLTQVFKFSSLSLHYMQHVFFPHQRRVLNGAALTIR